MPVFETNGAFSLLKKKSLLPKRLGHLIGIKKQKASELQEGKQVFQYACSCIIHGRRNSICHVQAVVQKTYTLRSCTTSVTALIITQMYSVLASHFGGIKDVSFHTNTQFHPTDFTHLRNIPLAWAPSSQVLFLATKHLQMLVSPQEKLTLSATEVQTDFSPLTDSSKEPGDCKSCLSVNTWYEENWCFNRQNEASQSR